MSGLFKLLGIAVAAYTTYAAVTGTVYAKSGVRWRIVTRTNASTYFWIVIAIYGALSVALLTIF